MTLFKRFYKELKILKKINIQVQLDMFLIICNGCLLLLNPMLPYSDKKCFNSPISLNVGAKQAFLDHKNVHRDEGQLLSTCLIWLPERRISSSFLFHESFCLLPQSSHCPFGQDFLQKQRDKKSQSFLHEVFKLPLSSFC